MMIVSIKQIFLGIIYIKKMQFQTILFPYKVCYGEENISKQKLQASNGFVVNTF
jgi:hypothetical protein